MRYITPLTLISIFMMHTQSVALPTNEVVISGNAEFQHQQDSLHVIQSSDFLHTQFDSFDIANNESVHFQQQSMQSVAINQVLNADPTHIAGQLSANGQLFILAPGGLVIHDGASIEAASFFTSTLKADSINANEIHLSQSDSAHGIINNGNISIQGGGSLQLLSNKIINNGSMGNANGDTHLSVANRALVRFSGDLFAVEVDESVLNGVIQNNGMITASGGDIQLNALVKEQIHEQVIHNQGEIIATSVWQEGGDIYIGSNEGDIENHGLIESVATTDQNQVAHIQINSDRIANFGAIKNNASGIGHAGSIELHAETTVVLLADSLIQANGDVSGDGGNIKVFSPDTALFREDAKIEAEAGFQLGNGGFVDVSGWEQIEINGLVSTLAINGENGEFLIDPYDVTISSAADSNTGFTGTTYTPSGTPSVIDVDTLITNLQAGDVTVVTTGGGGESGNITVSNAINLDGTHGNTLQLSADGSIIINAHIVDQSTGSADATNIGLQASGSISIADGVVVDSGGGVISISTSSNLSISNLISDGGNIFITAASVSDAGDLGFGYDIDAGGGTANFNVVSDIGGDSFATALEIVDSKLRFISSTANQNIYLDAGLSTADIIIGDIDYNGGNGLNFNIRATNGADIIFDGTVDDSNTGSADSATFNIQTSSVNGDLTITNGSTLRSRGGDITVSVLGDASLSHLWSDGGAINITADNIWDNGTGIADLNASGGLITLSASGNIGGSAFSSALEINDAILDIITTGTNQNVFLINDGTAGLTINNVDYNGTGTFNYNVRATNTGNLTVTGSVTDSAAGSTDVATINFETLNADSDIILQDGATIRSYGGDITYNTLGQLGIVRTKTDGGNLNITAAEVYDNGNTGPDIETLGGVVTFNVSGDVGVSANGSLEMRDSIIDGTVLATNATWDFRTYAATTYLSLGDIDFNGAGGFNLTATDTNGAELRVVGSILDSSPASVDTATFNLSTTQAGSHIVSVGDNKMHSYGGIITVSSAADIALPQLYSSGGAINLTAGGKIYDVFSGNDLSSGGGLLTINAVGDVGGSGTGQSSALEVFDSILNMDIQQNNKNVYFNVSNTDSYFHINNIDYDGGDGLVFDVRADSGADIVVTGDVYDSNTGTVDSATFNLVTNSNTSDITINSGATIQSGANGSITLNSANDVYLTGLSSGTAGTVVTAANDIINNGDVSADLTSTGTVSLNAGRHMADGDSINVTANDLNLNLGTGNHNIITIGAINLGNIEIDGANGAQVSIVGNDDITLTGTITDATGTDDAIDLTLGTSTPGFIIFPDAGYTVPGTLSFWDGTGGIKDGTDERVSITADSLISSGNNFLLNTGPVIFDLTVDSIDFNDTSGNISFEINNSQNLQVADLNSDGDFLLGKEFKLNVNGDLSIPNAFINDVDDQLWIIADDIDDPDADNIVTIRDSGDAGNDFNLIVELTAANDVHINTNISQFDGTVASGGHLTIQNSVGSATDLDLSNDLNSDGNLINGAGNVTISTDGILTLPSAGLNTQGDLFLTANDITDSDTSITLIGDQVFLQLDAPLSSDYIVNLTSNGFDVVGSNNLTINASTAMALTDLNSDGQIVSGFTDLDLNINGVLTLDNTGLSVLQDLNLNAYEAIDSDNNIQLSANRVMLNYTSPRAVEYGITGTISSFNANMAGNLSLNINSNITIEDWTGSGSTLENVTGFKINTSGNLIIPDSGLSTANYLWLQANSISDSDFILQNLNSTDILLNTNSSNQMLSLSGTFTRLDASLTGNNSGLLVQSSQNLQLLDLNADGNSLLINDGYAWIDVAGSVSLDGNMRIEDNTVDGQENGWMYLGYEGSAQFGMNGGLALQIDGSLESGTPGSLNVADSQLIVRQTGASSNSNTLEFDDADILVIGGNMVFDITNETGNASGNGTIQTSNNTRLSALNNSGDSNLSQPSYEGLTLNGDLSIAASREIVFSGYNLSETVAIPDPDPVDEDINEQINDALADIINETVENSAQSITNDIQEETVNSVESSPNMNFALNATYGDCQGNKENDPKCKLKDEMSRFLGQFLMGGSMIKAK